MKVNAANRARLPVKPVINATAQAPTEARRMVFFFPRLVTSKPAGRSRMRVPRPFAATIRPVKPRLAPRPLANSGMIGRTIPQPTESRNVGTYTSQTTEPRPKASILFSSAACSFISHLAFLPITFGFACELEGVRSGSNLKGYRIIVLLAGCDAGWRAPVRALIPHYRA
jgi:hypothetical protein